MSNQSINSYSKLTIKDIKALQGKTSDRRKQERRAYKAALGEAERKPKESTMTEEAKSLIAMTPNIGRSPAVFEQILSQHIKRDSEKVLINPRSNWSWDQRYAVKMRAPAISVGSISKTESLAQMTKWQATANPWMAAGYKAEYAYNPMFTHPYGYAWPTFAKELDPYPRGHEALREASKWVFVPPSPANMLLKIRKALSEDIPDTPQDIMDNVHKRFKIAIDPAEFVFPALGEDRSQWKEQAVDHVVSWLIADARPDANGVFAEDAPFPLKNTSPGLPWMLLKTATGGSYGSGHNPTLIEDALTGKDSALRRFLRATLQVYLQKYKELWWFKDGKPTRPIEEARQAIVELGLSVYATATGSQTPVMDSHGETLKSFQAHLTYNQLAGNVKPVLEEELADGKPDRSVYSTPYLARAMTTKLSHLAYKGMDCDYALKNFKFVQGGAQRLASDVLQHFGLDPESWVMGPPQYEKSPLRPLEHEELVYLAPDVKGMDLHCDTATIRDFHRHDLAKNVPLQRPSQLHHALLLMIIGISEGTIATPVVLFNSGLQYRPVHLNTSGNAFVYLINQKRSGAIVTLLSGDVPNEAYQPASLLPFTGGVKPFARASGDDQLYALRLPARETAVGEKLNANTRDPSGKYADAHAVRRLELAWSGTLDGVLLEGKEKAKHPLCSTIPDTIKKVTGMTIKPETLSIYRRFSDVEFLGHHVYVSREFSEMAYLAVRPLAKILFSVIWPKHAQGKSSPINPHIHTVLRVIGAYLEGAAGYPEIRQALRELYMRAYRAAASVNWSDERTRDLFNVEAGNVYQYGFDAPLEVLGEDFVLGRLPSLDFAWRLQTGVDLPRALGGAVEVSEGSEELDLEGLGAFDEPPSVGESKAAEVGYFLEDEVDLPGDEDEAVDLFAL